MSIYEVLKATARVIGCGCKVIGLLIVFVVLVYVLVNLTKNLWEDVNEQKHESKKKNNE